MTTWVQDRTMAQLLDKSQKVKLIFYNWEWRSLSRNQGSARISFQTTSEWDTRMQIKLCNFSYDLFGGPSKSPAELYERRVGHFVLNEHRSVSYLLCYFSKNSHEFATWELKLISTAFQVERQVHGNTSGTSLHACIPTQKCFSFSFSCTHCSCTKFHISQGFVFFHCITTAADCMSYPSKQLK